MKWYYWVLIAIAILVIIALVVKNNNKDKLIAVNSVPNSPINTFDPYVITPITTRK